jgi:spoIIIJ-associated protein
MDTKIKNEKLKIVAATAEKLLEFLQIEAKATVSEDKENEAVLVKLETKEAARLIGFHGETLGAFQLILALIVNRQLEKWQRVIVDVGDYRERRKEALSNLALNTAQQVKFSGQPAILSQLESGERRIIHLVLADHPEVETLSEGEGEERRLIIKPKAKTNP